MTISTRQRTYCILSGLLMLTLASTVEAASPRFTGMSEIVGTRGSEVETSLLGSNLDDAEELMLYDKGLEVSHFELVTDEKNPKNNGRRVNVKLKIAADAPLGTQRMRIRTKTGLSDLRNFYVTALPIAKEVEPNTDFDAPQAVALNTTVWGRVEREDVDYYVVDAKKGQRLSVEVVGLRLGFARGGGSNFFDPYVAILNDARFELTTADDTPLVFQDSAASIIVPVDGKYVIEVRDSAYNGDGSCYYCVNIGEFPQPKAVLPLGGKPGETLEVTFLDDLKGDVKRTITVPTEPQEDYGVRLEDETGIASRWNPFRISPLDNVIEQEPNNHGQPATVGNFPCAFNGVLAEDDDVDRFQFSLKKDQQVDIEVYARRLRSAIDAYIDIYDAKTNQHLGGDDDSRRPDSYKRFKAPHDGDFVVAIRDQLMKGGPNFTYRVEVTPITPSLTASPVEFARYVQQQLVIPQGGGVGIQANVQRQNFGGPVAFTTENLPAGVHLECPEGWATSGTMPVVLYAADDAPLAGTYADINLKLNDPKQKTEVVGPLQQDILMVRGQNNSRMWEERITRLPVVVTEKAPFKVRVEVPAVPMVKGGSITLKVIAERAEGFDEQINLRVLQNPPGCNSSASVNIPKGQTEATIPMNAAGNAAVQETMIAVRAWVSAKGGTIETCTPFVPVQVEERYLDLKFETAAVEQGKEAQMLVKVDKHRDFEGAAKVELVNLPAKVTTEPLEVTKDSEELVFTLKTDPTSPAGQHKNVFARVMVPNGNGEVLHNLGGGKLRIDKPLPPKKDEPKAEPKPEPVAQAPAKKPLSRLEQLRLQQQQRESGGAE